MKETSGRRPDTVLELGPTEPEPRGTAGPVGTWALQDQVPLARQSGVEGVLHQLMGSFGSSYTQDQDVMCGARCRVKVRGPR